MLLRSALAAVALLAGTLGAPGRALHAEEEKPVEKPAETPPAATDWKEFMRLWDFADPKATEARFRALLPEAERSPERGLRIELLTQIARTQGLQQRSADAHRTLDEAEALLEPGMVRPRVRLLLERGRATNGIPGATDEGAAERKRLARPYFHEAFEVASKGEEEPLALDALHMLAIVDPPEEALAWNRKAIAIAEASKNPGSRRWLGTLYSNTGWTHFERKEYAEALALFERDVALRGEWNQIGPQRIARWSRAKTLRMLGRVEEALEAQRALAKEWDDAGEPDGYVDEEMGECLLALGRSAEARPWFAKAHERLSRDEWLARNEPARLARLAALAKGEAPPVTK